MCFSAAYKIAISGAKTQNELFLDKGIAQLQNKSDNKCYVNLMGILSQE